MNERKVKTHDVVGFISPDGSAIVGYGHSRHPVGECAWCDFVRSRSIAREFSRRLELTMPDVRNLNMWSLGTSLYDTIPNRKLILKWWARYRNVLHKRGHRSIVFRVLEAGRRGLLHIHYVDVAFLDHSVALEAWRSLTGEKSNVHVSGQKGAQDVERLTRYLCKYLTKSSSEYRWCGAFYGLGRERSRRIGPKGGSGAVYGGVTCYSMKTEQSIYYGNDYEAQMALPGQEVNKNG